MLASSFPVATTAFPTPNAPALRGGLDAGPSDGVRIGGKGKGKKAGKAGKGGNGGKFRSGLSRRAEARHKADLRGNDEDGVPILAVDPRTGSLRSFLPSEPWVEIYFISIEDLDADGKAISVRFYDRKPAHSPLNPAAADQGGASKMVRCARCGRMCPPVAIEGGLCMDHRPEWVHAAFGSSPSAAAIAELQRRHLRIVEAPLPSEKRSRLAREIKRITAGKWRPRYQPPLPPLPPLPAPPPLSDAPAADAEKPGAGGGGTRDAG